MASPVESNSVISSSDPRPGARPAQSRYRRPLSWRLRAVSGPPCRAHCGTGRRRDPEVAAAVRRHLGDLGKLFPVHPPSCRAHAARNGGVRPDPARRGVPRAAGGLASGLPRHSPGDRARHHRDRAGHGRAHLPDRLGRTARQFFRSWDPHRHRPAVHRRPRPVADQVRGPGP